jgi:hypothetical protein
MAIWNRPMAREEYDINEDSHGKYTCTLKDEDDAAVLLTSIGSITMTLIEERTGTEVNDRTAQDVLNTNDCTYNATSGLFTWNVQIEDTDIVNTSTGIGKREPHLATISFLWASGTKQHHHEVVLNVLNLRSVPQA